MGVGTRTKAWRFTDINKDYSVRNPPSLPTTTRPLIYFDQYSQFCATYPARLVVPTKISDTTLQYAAKYRSKCRIPVLTYLHWGNYVCCQPQTRVSAVLTLHT
jgi:myotubularin-related protein 6/7/8